VPPYARAFPGWLRRRAARSIGRPQVTWFERSLPGSSTRRARLNNPCAHVASRKRKHDTRRTRYQYITPCGADDGLRDAADQHVGETRAPVRSQRQEVRPTLRRDLQDHPARIAAPQGQAHCRLVRCACGKKCIDDGARLPATRPERNRWQRVHSRVTVAPRRRPLEPASTSVGRVSYCSDSGHSRHRTQAAAHTSSRDPFAQPLKR
jgi:hypothetical protein